MCIITHFIGNSGTSRSPMSGRTGSSRSPILVKQYKGKCFSHLAATLTTSGARRPPIMAEKKAVITIGKVKRDTSCLDTMVMMMMMVNFKFQIDIDRQNKKPNQPPKIHPNLNTLAQTCQFLHIAIHSHIVHPLLPLDSLRSTDFLGFNVFLAFRLENGDLMLCIISSWHHSGDLVL